MYLRFGKRIFDALAAAAGLIFLLPLLAFIALLLFTRHRDCPIFSQKRTGLCEKPFKIYKFRTIRFSRTGEPLITRLDSFLRKSSLDELPQFWHILKGQMSFIGPRPLLPEYLSIYSDHDRVRHHVLPGMTGLAQVRGRNELAWSQKLRYDRWYCKHRSLRVDLYILMQTFKVVFSRDGVFDNVNDILLRYGAERSAIPTS